MQNIKEYLKTFEFFRTMHFNIYDLQPLNKPFKVFRVEDINNGKQYKVRLNTPFFPNGVSRELNIINMFASMPQKYYWMPQIAYLDKECNVLAIEYLEGDTLLSLLDDLTEDEKKKIKEDAFNILQALHTLPIPKYMNLETQQPIENWYNYMKKRFVSDLELTKTALQDEQKKHILAILENFQDCLSNVKLSLLHGDLKPSNIIYNRKTELLSLIDFESCKIGDAYYDISRMSYNCSIFYNKTLEKDEIYQLYKLDTFLHWLANTIYENKDIKPKNIQGIEECLSFFNNIKF